MKTTKWMNKKSSAIEKVMGNLKERSTRKNIDKSTTIIADGGLPNRLEDISMNKSIKSRESKTVNRRKSSTPALFKTEAREEQKLEPLTAVVHDIKTSSQGYSGRGYSISSKPSSDITACNADGFHNFTQAYARKKQTEKIKRILEKQKKKAEEGTKRKYAGFGETLPPVKRGSIKKRKKENDLNEDIVKKKPKVSKAELDLIEELLSIADSAMTESKSAEVNNDVSIPSDAAVKPVYGKNSMVELEEIQTNNPGVMVDDYASFFEL